MRLPPWAVDAIRNGVADVARKASDPETIKKVRQQASELLRELPDNASKSLDAIVKTASETARGAFDQGRSTILRWSERDHEIAAVAYNASGTLLNSQGTGIPLNAPVVQLGCDLLQGNCLGQKADQQIDDALTRQLDLSHHSMLVANNFDAAIRSLVALTGSQQRRIVVHRAHAIRLPSGLPLPDAFAGYQVDQCGGVGAVDVADFQSIERAVVVTADDGQHPLTPVALSGDDVIQVAVLPIATIDDRIEGVPSVKTLLQSDFDIVVAAAGPMIGAAPAGVIAGKAELLSTIRANVVWKFAAANQAIAAMLLSAMINVPSPLEALVDTAVDNLRSRAERMATRLTASPVIASCQINQSDAVLGIGQRWHFPSRQLRLRHRKFSAQSWATHLLQQTPAVIASVDGDDLVIDFRWLPASADSLVAEALAPSTDESESD
ncbi:hypothetical protein [Rhodopirellula sp. MGV]|uniref:hypothetical protein n=1 Tax=Rhodopirellula sp. MGV TaxID=2023130 RepID=UPI000B960F32|nr:hypothetical protein [Rhodopirellula sp. MGV]OYP36672.1 hypothetical protein CGZ80_07765 [Rhodopirellula sp. MGV]PNY36103.1 hypothetical protein C2E31_14725 [Rhodopirellula baltica]PNY36105.1 hypothetical protein C2E31_14740 [Rhodopirellula baltica]